jgi:hypothetical protein
MFASLTTFPDFPFPTFTPAALPPFAPAGFFFSGAFLSALTTSAVRQDWKSGNIGDSISQRTI